LIGMANLMLRLVELMLCSKLRMLLLFDDETP
jgi:hypothetical protein